ncbi:response regulator [Massilia pinisoli]|uniref:Response regulator n=1 Tax=Massilia pinisoli TaxID=1772194 RepID=A0ABT1ZK22_9BURK|nr:response regulator [Massilia pinisoli]MCS0580255.1 response regulator [Massilia pinisoli]
MTSPPSPASPEHGLDAAAYCSTRQAAALLGVSHRTVQLWVESGLLSAWKTAGGHRRIALASIERHVERRQQAMRDRAAPARHKALLVDDDGAMLALYEAATAGLGLPQDVVLAANGFEALLRIGETRPQLLIGDLGMPGVDGLRMIRTLRASDGYRDMGIVVITGHDPAAIRSLGVPDDVPILPKPVTPAALRAAVERALHREPYTER